MSLFSIGTVMAGIAHAFPILLSGTNGSGIWIGHYDATLNECDVSELSSRKKGSGNGECLD